MASKTHKPFTSRKLGQILQEKQEPFKLNIYLLERGYSRSEANSESFGWYDDANKLLTISVDKRTKMVSRFFKTLRSLANKLVYTNTEQRINSCAGKIATHRGKSNWRCMEKQQQLSPVSVLEEAHSDQNSPVRNVEEETSNVSTKKLNTIFSLESSPLKQLIDTEISLNHLKINTQLWRTPQLMFDCMMEVVQTYKLKNSRQQKQDLMGAEEIGRLVHENVLEWSKQFKKDGNRTATQLIDFELMSSFEDWKCDFQEQIVGIARVIGDSILNDIIINEFIHQ